MTDDQSAFDAELRQRMAGRTLTLTAETDDERDTQAAFRTALTPNRDRAADIRRRIFTEPATDDEAAK